MPHILPSDYLSNGRPIIIQADVAVNPAVSEKWTCANLRGPRQLSIRRAPEPARSDSFAIVDAILRLEPPSKPAQSNTSISILLTLPFLLRHALYRRPSFNGFAFSTATRRCLPRSLRFFARPPSANSPVLRPLALFFLASSGGPSTAISYRPRLISLRCPNRPAQSGACGEARRARPARP